MTHATSKQSNTTQREAAPAPVFNIIGERVALGPGAREESIDLFHRSDNDFAVTLLSGDPLRPLPREQSAADYDQAVKEQHPSWVGFLIYDLATQKAIGGVSLRHIGYVAGIAEFGIVISDKAYWGRGYGTETTILMLDYAFTILGLHSVMLTTYSYNHRAIRAYTRAGFREFGRWREAQRIGSKRYDVVFMDCLATEFTSPLKPIVELPE